MNKNTTIAIVLLIVFAIFGGFYFKNKAPVSNNNNVVTMCFIRNTEDGGKANIIMNISGDNVTGQFSWLPAERDSKTGPFSGKISSVDPQMMARTLNVWWNASAEGKTATEELKIIMGEGTATPGFGEMKDRGDGVYVYASPASISYAPNLSLADCADSAMNP